MRSRLTVLFVAPVLLGLAGPCPKARAQNSSGTLLTIRVEQQRGDAVRTVSPKTVFQTGDVVRFELTSQMAGYLYVVDKGTSGTTDTLFPGSESGDNQIASGRTYPVPADGDGWFQVTGPTGYDVLYFLVSATPISLPPARQASPGAQPPAQPLPPNLLPRCDDAIFKARGDCLDASAGAQPLGPTAELPRELVPLARSASRDIILSDSDDETSVKPAPSAKLPLIYAFRLAHRDNGAKEGR